MARLHLMVAIGALASLALSACNRPSDQAATAEKAAPAKEAKVTTYICADGRTLRASYPDPDTAVVDIDGKTRNLKIAISASGARYTGDGYQWWTKGMSEGQLSPLKPGEDIASAPGVNCSASDAAATGVAPAPGAPGGLPADKTPISEAAFTPQSAQGAANVVQTYYALVGEKKYDQAWKLWSDGGKASGQSAKDFSANFAKYETYNAQIGAPGDIDAGAGSLFVEVPVVISATLKTGEPVNMKGVAKLRRVNDVPGATQEQLAWHISEMALKPSPGG